MSFIAKHIVTADERIVYIARLHWIYYVKGLLWFLLFYGFGHETELYLSSLSTVQDAFQPVYIMGVSLGSPGQWIVRVCTLLGLFVFGSYAVKVLGTEIALTNTRMVIKTGLIASSAEELDLVEVKAETVHNRLLGKILGYGWVHLDCRFVDDVNLPTIRDPYRFLQVMHKTRAQASAQPVINDAA